MTAARQCREEAPLAKSSRANSRNSLPCIGVPRMVVHDDALENLRRKLCYHPSDQIPMIPVEPVIWPSAINVNCHAWLVTQLAPVVQNHLDPVQVGEVAIGI